MSVETERTAAEIWSDCLELVREKVNPRTYRTWFEPLVPRDLEQSLLTLEVPSTYFYEWIEEHFFDVIQDSLREVVGSDARLQYAVSVPRHHGNTTPANGSPGIIQADATTHVTMLPSGAVSGNGTPASGQAHYGMPHNGTSGNGNASYSSPPGNGGAPAHAIAHTVPHTLNPKFTFENFIRGDGNQFARAAAVNVSNNPGETAFNPLVIYGGVGLGKTHLVQAIGNMVAATQPHKRVYYVSSEKFTIDFVEAIEKNKTLDFTNFYRNMDVLIVDDIQFFSGKERTQDTFFHTFNTLYQLKKQIILSSDRPPRDLVGLDERLISRFQCGLTVDIQPPDLETRIAILRMKAEEDHIELPQDVIEFISSNVKSNIRELEGCYIGLIARHTLEQCPVTVDLAEKVLRNVIASEKKDLTVEQIQKTVSDHFKVSENSLRAKTRKQEIVLPRQIAMFLAKKLTRASLKTIGLHFGGRDHSTIIHACKTIENAIDNDSSVKAHVSELEKQLSYITG